MKHLPDYHEVENHPLADIFPPLGGDEYRSLKADICENGLHTPLLFAEDGRLLDGRHRLRAWTECLEDNRDIGDYESETVPEDQLVARVISANLHRRHLTESERHKAADLLSSMSEAGGDRQSEHSADVQSGFTQSQAAELFNTSVRGVANARTVRKRGHKDLYEAVGSEVASTDAAALVKRTSNKNDQIAALRKVRSGEAATLAQAARQLDTERNRKTKADEGKGVPDTDRWKVDDIDIDAWPWDEKYDFIITDPPYKREFLSTWTMLADFAEKYLKPGGLLVAMSGQYYLPQVMERLRYKWDDGQDVSTGEERSLRYEWVTAYVMDGNRTNRQSLHRRSVVNRWKPILVYTDASSSDRKPLMEDVVYCPPLDGTEQEDHEWGQNVGGFKNIIERLLPNEEDRTSAVLVADPFLGKGTTGVAALEMGLSFRGVDIDEDYVNIARSNLGKAKVVTP